MQIYEHNGYSICPTPHLVVATGSWKCGIVIKYNNKMKKYCNETVCFTKGEAVFHAIQFGKTLIDQGIVLFDEAV